MTNEECEMRNEKRKLRDEDWIPVKCWDRSTEKWRNSMNSHSTFLILDCDGGELVMDGQDANKQSRRNVVQAKSFDFALRIIQLIRRLQRERRDDVLAKQLLRSGTSIGANIEEAVAAQSKKDFHSKTHIAMKEARETHYWLRLIHCSALEGGPEMEALLQDCKELVTILSSITLTTRQNLMAKKPRTPSPSDNSSFHIPHSTFDSGGPP
jgi:four helix bundle protein